MARKGTTSGDYLRGTSGFATAPAQYTVHVWYRNDSTPAVTGDNRDVVGMSDSTDDYNVAFAWDHSASPKTWYHKQADDTYKLATYTTSPSADTWYALGATYDGTNLKAWLNGAVEATTAATALVTGLSVVPCAFSAIAGTSPKLEDGAIAEWAIWNDDLVAAEMEALADAASPLLIRPANLIFYAPLVRDIVSWKGPALTSSATSVFDHPRVIYPSKGRSLRWTAGATHHETFSGGVSVGGSGFTAAAAYAHTPGGGVTVGGAGFTVASEVSWSTSIGVTPAGADVPAVSTSVTVATAFSLSDHYASVSTDAHVKTAFSANSGELANGRFRDVPGRAVR